MKEEESKILSKLGKEPGFKTPENYFSDFQNNIAEKLPNFSVSEEKVKPNLWVRFRPYVYMAAMFAGIFCMIQVFDVLNGTSGENAIAKTAQRLRQNHPGQTLTELERMVFQPGHTLRDFNLL